MSKPNVPLTPRISDREDEHIPLPEQVAMLFHDTYERLAPDFGYATREASAKPWFSVPEQNRSLMVATCTEVLQALGLWHDDDRPAQSLSAKMRAGLIAQGIDPDSGAPLA